MAWLGRANDIIRHRIKSLPHGGELRRRAICQKLRRGGFARCRLLHLLAMLVHARDEKRVIAIEALEARDCIGRDPFIGMADMRRPIGIGNGSGDVERPATGHGSQTLPASWHSDEAVQAASVFAAFARSAKRERTIGRLSRFKTSASRAASAAFSHTSASGARRAAPPFASRRRTASIHSATPVIIISKSAAPSRPVT